MWQQLTHHSFSRWQVRGVSRPCAYGHIRWKLHPRCIKLLEHAEGYSALSREISVRRPAATVVAGSLQDQGVRRVEGPAQDGALKENRVLKVHLQRHRLANVHFRHPVAVEIGIVDGRWTVLVAATRDGGRVSRDAELGGTLRRRNDRPPDF